MRCPSNVPLRIVVGALAGLLLLVGYSEQDGMARAGSSVVGPVSATTPTGPPAEPSLRMAKMPVARLTSPAEVPVKSIPVAATSPFLRDIFFDYDTSVLRDDQKAALDANLLWLSAEPRAKLTIEGYCDERGTPEYNLTLGERRANAVKDYLVAAGIRVDRITTASFGKAQPFVIGRDKRAWSQNRRARLVVRMEDN